MTQRLLELENVETGEPAVERVIKVREGYSGEHADALPDLSVV